MGNFLSIIFWGPVILILICAIYASVSQSTDGIMRRTDRKQKRYYRENMDE